MDQLTPIVGGATVQSEISGSQRQRYLEPTQEHEHDIVHDLQIRHVRPGENEGRESRPLGTVVSILPASPGGALASHQ